MLAPIVRILATVGISSTDISQTCAREFKRALRRLPKRRLTAIDSDPRYPDMVTRWATHPRYHSNGRPADLRQSGRAPSFASLVREIEPSLAPRAVLKDWRRLKLIRLRTDGRVVLLRRFVRTKSGSEFDFRHVSRTTSDFLHALEFNILGRTQPGKGLFQRHALSYDIHPKLAPAFNKFARDQAMLLLECIDDWLARHRGSLPKRRRKPFRLGLGIYVVNESLR